jgi:predicted AAA+ superfamily ATPase
MPDLDRTLRRVIEKTSKGFRVILLNGQRHVEKSTLLKNMVKGTGRKHVSLDNMRFRALAQSDPELFLQQYIFWIRDCVLISLVGLRLNLL